MGISLYGFDSLVLTFDEMSEMPESVLDDMLEAGAAVAEREIRAVGKSYGVHRTGVMLDSIGHNRPRPSKDGRAVYIYPQGSRPNGSKTKRNAEVAFINEFGKKNQAPRPFMRDAAEKAADEAAEQEEKVLNDYLSTKGL